MQSAQNREQAIERAFTRVAELATLAASEEDDSLQEASNLLRVLKYVPAIVGSDRDSCHALLRDITNEHPRIDLISVERADGTVACTSEQPVPPSFTLADRTWFREATAADAPATVISDLLVSRAKGYPGVIVASGLRRPGSDLSEGAISALMKLDWFSTIATKLSGSTGAFVQIADVRSGTVIAQSSEGGGTRGGEVVAPQILQAIARSPEGTMEVETAAGQTEIVGFRWLPSDQDFHSTVLVRMQRSAVVQDANQRLLFGMLTIIATLLIGIALAWCVAEISLVRPFSALVRMALQLGGGDLEARVVPQRFGIVELKVLGDALNKAVEQLQARDAKLEQLSLRDGLTELANRRCFDIALGREWLRSAASERPVALLMIDVDHFKSFNDTYGHPAGDACLRRIAGCLQQAARPELDLPARYGGEEIALLLPTVTAEHAIALSRQVLAAVRALNIAHAASALGRVTVSVGVAFGTPDTIGDAPECLIEAADRALYEAKRGGRNRAVCAVDPPADAAEAGYGPPAGSQEPGDRVRTVVIAEI